MAQSKPNEKDSATMVEGSLQLIAYPVLPEKAICRLEEGNGHGVSSGKSYYPFP